MQNRTPIQDLQTGELRLVHAILEQAGTTMAFRGPIDTDTLTTKQVGRMLGVCGKTVQRMCAAGELPCTITAGGHRRVLRTAVTVYLNRFRLAAPANDNAQAQTA